MSVRYDVSTSVIVVAELECQSVAASGTVNGASVDTRDYPGYRFMVVAGVGAYTDGSYTFSVEDSADNSSFATKTPYSGSFSAITEADQTQTASVVPASGRPYIRVSLASTSVTTGAAVYGHVIAVPPYGNV